MIPKLNNPMRDEIAEHTEAFLAKGGKIQKLPYGPDEFMADDYLITTAEKARLEKAREKGSNARAWKKTNNSCFGKDISSEQQSRRSNARKNKFKTEQVAA